MDQSDLPSVIITLIIVAAILFLGTFTGGQVLAATDSGGQVDTAVTLDDSSWQTLDDNVGQNEVVVDSLGNAINTTGASDSTWQSTDDVDIATDDTWTVSLWAAVDPGATNRNMTVMSVNGRIVISYNGSADKWRAWYYDDGSTNSYQVAVNATNQPATLTQLYITKNQSSLTIYRNTTQGDTVSLSGTSTVAAPTGNSGFDGRTDEVRAFDDTLNASQRSSLHQQPVRPLVANRTARVMFDQPDRQNQLLFYNSGQIATSNASFADGLPGTELDGKGVWNDLTGSTDYRWDTIGPRFRPVDGGALEDAPVAYVEYDQQTQLTTLADDWNDAIQLASVLIVLMPLGVIVIYLRGGSGRR